MADLLEVAVERLDMEATNSVSDEKNIVNTLRPILFSTSALSKRFILDNGLFAAIIDDNHLYDDEGHALMKAFSHLGMRTFSWCKTSDVIDAKSSVYFHEVNCAYEDFVSQYLEYDESIQFWDRIIFVHDRSAIVLHTAHDHIIYAGSQQFVNEATQRINQFDNEGLSTIGTAFADPELIAEYQLRDEEGNNSSPVGSI